MSKTPDILTNDFTKYAQCLEKRHKISEQIRGKSISATADAKRIITLLHQITDCRDIAKLFNEVDNRFVMLRNDFKTIAMQIDDARDLVDPLYFYKAYTAGIEEMIEAMSFYWFLRERRLLSPREVKEYLRFSRENADQSTESDKTQLFVLYFTIDDYIAGLADFTGELMRYATNCASKGEYADSTLVLEIIRPLYNQMFHRAALDKFDLMHKKSTVMFASISKVETLLYRATIKGRGAKKRQLERENKSSVHLSSKQITMDWIQNRKQSSLNDCISFIFPMIFKIFGYTTMIADILSIDFTKFAQIFPTISKTFGYESKSADILSNEYTKYAQIFPTISKTFGYESKSADILSNEYTKYAQVVFLFYYLL
ncbi:hypothetical protein GJ496_009431 [Pomphorhynchus laevis]|nr:hypothetical protein GJ496_009431 [Pomphorhynchus laevis]